MRETEVRGLPTGASWVGRVAEVEADARPGRYYVTARDAGRVAFLVGPFVQPTWGKQAHARALGAVRRTRALVQGIDARADFWTFGTVWVPLYGAAPTGKLNGKVAR